MAPRQRSVQFQNLARIDALEAQVPSMPENLILVVGSVAGGAVLLGVLAYILIADVSRRRRTKRLLIMALLNEYFLGDMTAAQLGQRIRATAGRHFLRDWELFALVTTAFQGTADSKLPPRAHSEADERRLLRLLAALKKEFGLADRYQIEGWRPGRE
jgi:hypothetical protein